MSCTAIMTKAPPVIPAEETVAHATAKLIESHYISLPVVDADGRYAGMFGIHDLFGLLVPRVALAGDLTANLRFIAGDPGELRSRYDQIKHRRISEVADRNGARLDPDASETEAIRLCCRNRTPIPVVEKESGKVIGIISCWDAISALAGMPKQN
jgi:CBS domain-containing protein